MRSDRNLCILTDSYKVSHWKQYPLGTQNIYSYFESRGGQFPEIVFFGLHYFLKEYLERGITLSDIDYAADRWTKHFGDSDLFNKKGWYHLYNKYQGKLPLLIKSVPEGTILPISNVIMTVENTDPEFPWLTNWFETLLSQVWYPCTVATLSREVKKIINRYLEKTGDPNLLSFKLHDFGYRGVSSNESAALGGAAHLVNFMGTDTAAGFELTNEYYDCEMAGFSIPAAEHSTITSWGGPEFECDAFENMIRQFGNCKTGLYAVVSDSYDIINACRNLWGNKLKTAVLAAPNTLIVRPDSGKPELVVLQVLEELGNAFGFTINSKGFKVLNKVRVIQGDGIQWITSQRHTVESILSNMAVKGWSADNIAFGSGGGLLQQVNRDTQKFAFKCSSITINNEEKDVWKQPITDSGKNSKRGRLRLLNEKFGWQTVRANEWREGTDQLIEVFRDGQILHYPLFNEIRERAKI